jgi:O-antigen/teichoic acid export membrane protein
MSEIRAAAGGAAAPQAPRPHSKGVSVKRGFGWSLAGYVIYMVCQWAIMVVLTRWGSKDLADVALFAMALATTTPIILFSNLGLRRVYATDANSGFRFSDYFTLRMTTNVAALLVVAVAVWVQGYRTELVWVTLAMGAAKMIESTSDLLHGFFQERRRIDVSSRATIFRGVLSLVGFVTGFMLTRQVFWGVIGMGAGWAAVLVGYEWPWTRKFLRTSEREASPLATRHSGLKGPLRLAFLTAPIGVVALVMALKGSIPTFVIEANLGETALGIFAALIYFFHGINRVVSSLGEAAAARFASLHAARDQAGAVRLLSRMLGVSLAISAVGVLGAVVFGEPIVRLFYDFKGPLFSGLGTLLVGIMVAASVANLQTVFDYAMMAIRRFRIQPYMYGAGAGLLLLLCITLVPTKGLSGAVWALGISSGVELLASAAIVGWSLYGRPMTGTRPAMEVRG